VRRLASSTWVGLGLVLATTLLWAYLTREEGPEPPKDSESVPVAA
jgi:hypothetical protein